jgi:prepilin-type N-terminal cleavage/methylation domain-containing protein
MSNRKGFTLIELLIVVVIIGILAAIAIPKFAATKEKAYLASMKSDLRNLATAQESYFADNTAYIPAGQASNINGAPQPFVDNNGTAIFTPSTGVTVTVAIVGGGWTGTAEHTSLVGRTCDIFVNTGANAFGNATSEGEPRCN